MDTSEQPVEKLHSLILPYVGPIGNTIIKTLDISLKRILHDNVKTRATYTGHIYGSHIRPHIRVQNLVQSSRLKIKWKINTNMILFITLSVQNQLVTRSADHCGTDKQLHLLTYALFPWWNPPWHGEGAYLTKRLHPMHQNGELVGTMLLRSSRTNRSSQVLCQGLDLILKSVVTLAFHS